MLLSFICGILLSSVRLMTEERIEEQLLHYTQAPAVNQVLASSTNDPVADRLTVQVQERDITVFIGIRDASIEALAFETEGSGFGGDLGVMVGYDTSTDTIKGVGITRNSETPGIGSRIKAEGFMKSFIGLVDYREVALKKDGGKIDGITGATISSRAVCSAVQASMKLYQPIKSVTLSEGLKNE
jgi:electron transport complex protein RnfG